MRYQCHVQEVEANQLQTLLNSYFVISPSGILRQYCINDLNVMSNPEYVLKMIRGY